MITRLPHQFFGAVLLAPFNDFQAIVLFDRHYYNDSSALFCYHDRSGTGGVNQATEAVLGDFRI